MLADVRLLRQNGIRIPRERIDALPPVRGELLVFKRVDPWRNCSVPVASLVATDRITYVLPPLDQVRIARWQGSDLVLVGLEEAANVKGERPNLQSWWVHLVSDRDQPRTSPAASVE